jgi:hypothetical protein
MARFVLHHGAFAGAWCWEPLAKELADAGHSPYLCRTRELADFLTRPSL